MVREARPPHARTAPSPPLPASPALVDVDVIYAVGAEGCLGQCLNHMVTLQHHVPLGAQMGSGVRPCPELEKHPPPPPPPPPPSPPRGTFCLLSSRCTWSTKRLSLRLLTEIPEAEGQRSGIKGQSRGPPHPALDSGSPVRLAYSILCLTLASSTMTTALGVSSSCRERGL